MPPWNPAQTSPGPRQRQTAEITATSGGAGLWQGSVAACRLRTGSSHARFVRIVPASPWPGPMIVWIPQLISCGIHTKSEIPARSRRPRARPPHGSPRTALRDGGGPDPELRRSGPQAIDFLLVTRGITARSGCGCAARRSKRVTVVLGARGDVGRSTGRLIPLMTLRLASNAARRTARWAHFDNSKKRGALLSAGAGSGRSRSTQVATRRGKRAGFCPEPHARDPPSGRVDWLTPRLSSRGGRLSEQPGAAAR